MKKHALGSIADRLFSKIDARAVQVHLSAACGTKIDSHWYSGPANITAGSCLEILHIIGVRS